jgi:hypothetical protein
MSHEPFFNSITTLLEEELDAETVCIDIANTILKYAAHVPLVTNIARGAGFCYYYARIAEAIGARHMLDQRVSRIAGKGSTVHKLLGIISLRLFSQGIHYALTQVNNIRTFIEEILQDDDLRQVLQVPKDEIDATIILSSQLMMNLLSNLSRMLTSININPDSKVNPIVEQQFIDYTLHMRGVPDLILEFPEEQSALVIEWKTTRDTPMNHEKAQVVCYALMEAVRLGYRTKDRAINAVMGELSLGDASPRIINLKVLPAIIRPTQEGRIEPHPIMVAEPSNLKEKYDKFKKLIYDVCLMAEHLTLLTANIRDFSSMPISYYQALCTKKLSFANEEVQASIFRIKPKQITSGFPKKRDKFPCIPRLCHYNYEYGPCEFYFGRSFGEKTDFDSAMWSLRFKIFREKERMLLPYRALHELFRSYSAGKVIEKIKNGEGFVWYIGEAPYPSTIIKMRMDIFRHEEPLVSFRIDVLDEGYVEGDIMFGYRKLRNIEINERIYRVIPEGKPVFITIVDSWTPLLSIGAFGRIDEVRVEEDSDRLEYVIGLPSPVLRYSMLIFGKYLRFYPERRRNILISEMNVDLLGAELQSIDAMQRAIKMMLEVEKDEYIKRGLENQLSEVKKAQEEFITLEPFLSRIIGRGLRSRGGE